MIEPLETARQQMIGQQVRSWDVLDPRVLETLGTVPRERFVPEAYRGVAFADAPIPIGHGQFMLPPKIEGRILQALAPVRGERVLEVGTGTGFFAACLAELAGSAETLEIHADLAAAAGRNLAALGVRGVRVSTADALRHPLGSGYHAIALTGSLPAYDPRFEQALVVGGRLFAVVGQAPVMKALLITRTAEAAWLSESLFETSIEPLLHAAVPSRFQF